MIQKLQSEKVFRVIVRKMRWDANDPNCNISKKDYTTYILWIRSSNVFSHSYLSCICPLNK